MQQSTTIDVKAPSTTGIKLISKHAIFDWSRNSIRSSKSIRKVGCLPSSFSNIDVLNCFCCCCSWLRCVLHFFAVKTIDWIIHDGMKNVVCCAGCRCHDRHCASNLTPTLPHTHTMFLFEIRNYRNKKYLSNCQQIRHNWNRWWKIFEMTSVTMPWNTTTLQ